MPSLDEPPIALPSFMRGADGDPAYLGEPAAELAAASQGSFLADLSQFSILAFSGSDAAVFLQAQLSCDVEPLAGQLRSTFGSYCTPKGRMLANFLLWHEDSEWRMMLSKSIAEPIQKRLGMYVLRAKVTITSRLDFAIIGLGGEDGREALAQTVGEPPLEAHKLRLTRKATVVALPGQRWIVVAGSSDLGEPWRMMASKVPPVGRSAWDWSDIRNGIPWVTAPTQDQFVPQMANLELIGGVSFKKGCYPGQEIVARMQYLGKLKRRLYLGHVAATADAGLPVYSDDLAGQATGMVMNAAPSPEGGSDMLVVVQIESAERSRVHLGAPDGPLVQFRALPYPLT